MIKKTACITALILGLVSLLSQAAAPPLDSERTIASSSPSENSSSRTIKLFFEKLDQQPSDFTLSNFISGESIEFSLRKDELVSQAILHLHFIPSPALIPVQSQLKIFINEVLVDVVPISAEQLGKLSTVDVAIDPHYISDFNRLRLEFIGHYNAICENPAHTSVWLDISKRSFLELSLQTLLLKNDLSYFPEPFFDSLDDRPLTLPIVFAGQPDVMQQRAAAILASWFGSKALWRGVSFSALFNQLPTSNAIVLATNEQRPDFLKSYKTVDAPTIEMINHPNNPYIKLLLILGRDDNDLLTAIQGLTQGNVLFRGQSVIVGNVKMLKPRKAYDAPNWARTDKPVTFAELQHVQGQLQTTGFNPYPIALQFNLPPDLFLNQSRGIDLRLKYRYSPPPKASISHLDLSLNNSYIKSYPLDSKVDKSFFSAQNLEEKNEELYIPVAHLGVNNTLAFQFQYGSQIVGGMQNKQCTTYSVINNFGSIDDSSTINFSNYFHYIDMPNLAAFAKAGFPFSRLADLSQTRVLINPKPQPEAVSTLLNVIGSIGAQTGYPALAMTLTDDWSQMKNQDADLLIIGTLPEELRRDKNLNLLMSKTQDWVKEPLHQNILPESSLATSTSVAESKTTVDATGAISVILGIQSPYYKNRSIVALLAQNSQGFELLNKTLTEKNKLTKIFGSVAVIRNSGVDSLRVGTIYHLGYLPWWEHLWFALHKHPINLALISLLTAIIVTFLIWNGLSAISRRRLKLGQQDKK